MRKKNPFLIPGFHGVRECLAHGQVRIRELWIAEGKRYSGRIREILEAAKARKVPVIFKSGKDLSALLPKTAHQGIVALADEFIYSDLEHIMDVSLQSRGRALLIAADRITDEGNLGSLIRTAAFFGAHGLIIPKNRSAGVTPNVLKRASGGYASLPVARVVNLARALSLLKEKGFWIIGTSEEASESIYRFDWNRDLVLVLGSEQKGMGRTIRQHCHEEVGIPSFTDIGSLNVGVAAGVVLSEIVRQRKGKAPDGPY
ncbi:MAG: 23S rRNA (guanosine(2251)-2'-O)-methyltransferase RlmB [Desulfobacterales bacterium]|nr:23S rRNA (guanosine(2251)-2'-O)-methyltransferase RlmB [Desulfobacterales bacterium]